MRFVLMWMVVGVCLLPAVKGVTQEPATTAPAPSRTATPAPAAETQAPASQATPPQATQSQSSQSPTTEAPATPQPQTSQEPGQKSAEEIFNEEKKQKMLGVVPMYGVTYYHNAPALTKGQKFDLMISAYKTPFPYLAAGFQAGLGQASDNFDEYGQGATGYAKRFGAAFTDGFDSSFFSNFFYPVLFKQDPRYFRLGEGTIKRRIIYALEWEFLTKKDSDRSTTFNYSNVLGALTAGGISNAYYPASDRGFGLTMSRAAISFAWGWVGNAVLEFWPDVSRGVLHKHKSNDVPVK